ncbi:MAG: protein kinase [Anaeromyxobacter sp.]
MDRLLPGREDLTQISGQRLGNYRLERVLGRGRMGVVYLARDEALLRPTAVKVLSWSPVDAQGLDPVQWFLAEARLVARINHPRVVQVYGAGRQGPLCYIAMEYVAGPSAEAAAARGPMRPDLATDVLAQAAAALQAAHGCGVVHRDVKPANLLLGPDGVTKLGDFGLAVGPDAMLGNAHVRVGTPYYTAPEIWRGEPATPATDLYALGATYYQLLTGRPPYPGADPSAVERGHLHLPVPDPREVVPDLPPACAAVVVRALAKAPRGRHASAQVLAWDARRVLQELAASAPPGGSAARPHRARRELGGPLADVLGFTRRPFSDVDPVETPYRGEPIASAVRAAVEALEGPGDAIVAVTGEAGAGRAQVCRAISATLGASRRVVHLDLARGGAGQGVLERLQRAAGAPPGAGSVDGLVERLSDGPEQGRPPPIVVLDGVVAGSPAALGLAELASAALWSRAFRLALAGAPGLREGLVRAGLARADQLVEVVVPPLTPEQVGAYVRSWVDASRPGIAPALVFSPDAVRLLALRSRGSPEQVGQLAENMLVLAARDGSRVLTSWHAWAASERDRWDDPRSDLLPRPPPAWPTPEVRELIDACRRSAGVPPWPRTGTS